MNQRGVEVRIGENTFYCEQFFYQMSCGSHHKFRAVFVLGSQFLKEDILFEDIEFIVTDYYGLRHSLRGLVSSYCECDNDDFYKTVVVEGGSVTLLMDRDKGNYSYKDVSVRDIINDRMVNYKKKISYSVASDIGGVVGNIAGNVKYGKTIRKVLDKGIPDKKLETELPYRAKYQQTDWEFLISLLKDFDIPVWYSGTKLIIGEAGSGGKSRTLVYPKDFLYLGRNVCSKGETYVMNLHALDIELGDPVVVDRYNNLSKRLRIVSKKIVYEDKVATAVYEALPCNNAESNLHDEPLVEPVLVQIGTVKYNNDPARRGRVQVQLDWQKKVGEIFCTNWIECCRCDAGLYSNSAGGRGMFYIPEVGDRVVVSYHDNDINDPFVFGSIYTSKSGKWDNDTNDVKSLSTRSGHKILFDDARETGKILITDRSGNAVLLSSKDDCLSISSPDNIKIEAPVIDIRGKKSVTIACEKDLFVLGKELCEISSQKLCRVVCSKDIVVDAKEDLKLASDENMKFASGSVLEISSGDNMIIENKKDSCWSGRGKIDIKSGVRVNIAKR